MVETDFRFDSSLPGYVAEPGNKWGPVIEIWEGHASDPEIRFKGASGGLLTSLSAYCLEVLGMEGVLHTAQDPEDPVRNRTRLSRTREDLMAATGSRYSPGSVCNGFGLLGEAPGTYLFIGRPAEVAALKNGENLRPDLKSKVGAVFSFFCAEAPCTRGTLDLLGSLGLKPEALASLRYRGEGWPGHFAPVLKGKGEPALQMTYRESWSFLQAYRPWSAHLWPDGTGELADISCGDPWYMEPKNENPGSSLVVVRTERGREILHGAMEKGYLELRKAEPWKLIRSQEGLVKKKGAVWGRLQVMRLLGLPVPRFRKGRLFKCWAALSPEESARSILGTLRRIIRRKLYRPLDMSREEAVTVSPPMRGSAKKILDSSSWMPGPE